MLGSTDLTGDTFGSALWLSATEVQDLSSSGPGQNVLFHDIDIVAGTLPTGQTLALSVIGSGSTASLRYVFPGNFTIASGAKMTVAAGLPVLIQPGVTLTDSGTATFASGASVSMANNFSSTQQIIVTSGGLLSATGTTFAGGGVSNIIVNAGGQLQATNSTFASSLTEVFLDNGSVLGSTDLTGDTFDSSALVAVGHRGAGPLQQRPRTKRAVP